MVFIASCLVLTWAGGKPVSHPYILVGQIATLYFFTYFFVCVPLLGRLESELAQDISGSLSMSSVAPIGSSSEELTRGGFKFGFIEDIKS